ncbi:MAG: PP0621 family protein [Burkholderiales bacterium]
MGGRPAQATRRGAPDAASQAGELVACAHCGVHLPRLESLQREGEHYCGEEHARLGPRRS